MPTTDDERWTDGPPGEPAAVAGATGRRSLGVAVVVGVGAGLALFLVAASLLTIPLFALARFTEPEHGLDRHWFSEGLRWAVAGGLVFGTVCAVVLGRWFHRGGRIPDGRPPWE